MKKNENNVTGKLKTVTFLPESDLEELLSEAEHRGRGVRTLIINQALRESGRAILKRWDLFRKPDAKASPFKQAEFEMAGIAA